MTRRMKRAISYIRFSDKRQRKGDSVRRQLDWAPQLCQSKGWILDESFDLQDSGVSAFRGKNADVGKLAAFLQEIERGTVLAGDVLLVESLDRLSRDAIDDAYELWRKILKSGVEIYTREPDRHYTKESLNRVFDIMEALFVFSRANEESSTKSMRGKEFWGERRKRLESSTPKPIHQITPAWLRVSKDGERFEVIPEAAKVIKQIYKWAGEGMGLDPITGRLNQQKIKPIGNNIRKEVFKQHWSRSYVAKLLRDRAVIGEFQPHAVGPDGKRMPYGDPIPNYFPQIITEEEWYRVRQAVKNRGTQRGPCGVGIANLFTSLIHDAHDGETMHLVYSGSSRKNNTRMLVSYGLRCNKYLKETNKNNPTSVFLPFPYDGVERAFLELVKELKVADIMGNNADDKEEQINCLEEKWKELDQKINKLQERGMQEKELSDALIELLDRMDNEKKETARKMEQLKLEVASQGPSVLGDVQSLLGLLEETQGEERLALRNRIKARIKQLVSEMWLLAWEVAPGVRAAQIDVYFHKGGHRSLFLLWTRRGRNRGKITSVGTDWLPTYPIPDPKELRGISEEEQEQIKKLYQSKPIPNPIDLRQYRSNPKAQKAHKQLQGYINKMFQQVVQGAEQKHTSKK